MLQLELKQEKARIKANPNITDPEGVLSRFRTEKELEYGVQAFGSLGETVNPAEWEQKIVEAYQWDKDEFFSQSPTNIPLQMYLKERDRFIRLQRNGGTYKGITVPPNQVVDGAYVVGERDWAYDIRNELHAYAMELIRKYPSPDYHWSNMYYGVFYRETNNKRYGD